MQVEITVLLRHHVTLPDTAVCRVEVRDVTYVDVSSITLAAYEARITEISNQTVLTTTLKIPDDDKSGRDLNVWAHLSLTGEKQIQDDDYVTTRAYSLETGGAKAFAIVELQPVRPGN